MQLGIIDQLADIPSAITLSSALFLLPALIIWLIFYRDRGRYTQLARGVGSVLFGFFWLSQMFVYFGDQHRDMVNGLLSGLGVLLFIFIAYHLFLDHLWKERTKSLIWLVRTAAITGSLYFIFEHIPFTQGALIYVVSWLTYYVLILFGNSVTIESGFPMELNEGLTIWSEHPIHNAGVGIPSIAIVFACTGALALSLFTAAVIATRTDRSEWEGWAKKEIKRTRGSDSLRERFRRSGIINTYRMSDRRRKAFALLTVIPVIFFTNIFRNVGIISAVYSDIIPTFGTSLSPFEIAHNYLSKALSLAMMMFLTWVLFEYLPELQENLMGLFDLFKRDRKGMIVDGRLDMKYVRGGETADE